MRCPLTNHLLVSCVAVAGCAPGLIHWDTGVDDLRTALFVERSEEGLDHTTILLSTGIFGCGVPKSDDPQVVSEALAALTVGACREDARHLVIDLYADPALAAEGTYPYLGPDGPQPDTSRGAEARYVGIEEAVGVPGEGLVPTYVPVEITRYDATGAPGDTRIRHAGDAVRSGTFDLPDAGIWGRFTATRCTGDTTLFDLLAASPVASCVLTPVE
jgi:hypothetical protein